LEERRLYSKTELVPLIETCYNTHNVTRL